MRQPDQDHRQGAEGERDGGRQHRRPGAGRQGQRHKVGEDQDASAQPRRRNFVHLLHAVEIVVVTEAPGVDRQRHQDHGGDGGDGGGQQIGQHRVTTWRFRGWRRGLRAGTPISIARQAGKGSNNHAAIRGSSSVSADNGKSSSQTVSNFFILAHTRCQNIAPHETAATELAIGRDRCPLPMGSCGRAGPTKSGTG
jgi:hypothetical protein